MARPGLTSHRKFRRLARALGSAMTARGALELLWESCYEAGDDYVGTAEDIEHLVGWTGASSVLTSALADAGQPEGVGFIEPAVGRQGYRVHDLWHHAPDYVTNRRSRETERRVPKTCERCGMTFHATDARSKYCSAACRQGGWRDRNVNRNEPENNGVTLRDTDRNTPPAPAPAPAPAPKAKNSSETLRASEPTALTFPIDGTGGPTWLLSEAQVAEWATLFPSLDVLAECRSALAWVKAKPSRQKTGRGMPAFLVGWLTRSNDSGRGSRREQPASSDEARRKLGPDRGWECPHVVRCDSPGQCSINRRLGRPERAGVAS